ncbi:MAG TPA: DUF5691 domain-containing protein [Anaerolineae bacterium]|nr:DUF5691 domain-containing protein [Anaerolineae bacterium]
MTQWNDLVAAALVGTGRTPFAVTGGTTPLDATLAPLAERPPEQQLLAAAGAVGLWRHVGAQPTGAALPLPAPAPADEAPECPPAAAALLGRMLHGDSPDLLAEWLAVLKVRGYALPPRWLPELLDVAETKPAIVRSVREALGARGRWLAAQNPRWSILLETLDPAEWDTLESRARFRLIEHLRETEPQRAPELLANAWAKESADARAFFLEMFREGLSPADEPFLESTLDDRSKKVRALAAELLTLLPGSALVRRMTESANEYLTLARDPQGQPTLKVKLPKQCDDLMFHDGIVETPPKGTGKRAWWLSQILSAVPPAHWSAAWNLAPAALIQLADAAGDPPGDHAELLLSAWAAAAARSRDAAWADALLQRWGQKRNFSCGEHLATLMQLVAPARITEWLETRLYWFQGQIHDEEKVEDDFGMLDLLEAYPGPWNDALSRAVVDTARTLAAKPMRGPSPLWRWAAALPDFAHKFPSALAPEAARDWPETAYWRSNVEKFQAILHFRWEISKVMSNE